MTTTYRKFWLENSLGNKYLLTDKTKKHYFNNPTGFGFSRTYTIDRLGNETVVQSEEASMPQPSGEILFYDGTTIDKYSEYKSFVQFCKNRPLKLFYQTPDEFTSKYIECEITSLEKSEVSEDNILHCPITFYGLSFWKDDTESTLIVTNGLTGEGKEYPYEYPYTYNGNNYQEISITNNGTMAVGLKWIIENSVTNPTLQFFDEDSNKYGEIKLNGTFTYVEVNTIDSEQEVILKNGSSVLANPTSYFDLSGDGSYDTPFPKLKVGKSRLTFSSSGTFTSPIKLIWQDNYITY